MSGKKIGIFLGLVLLAAGGVFFWKNQPKEPERITSSVLRMDLEDAVLATGIVHARTSVNVGAQVSGQLQRLHVELGDRVQTGTLLAEIDPQQQLNALKNARAGLALVTAQEKAKKALLHQYTLELTRQKHLLVQDATSRAEYERVSAQAQTAQADIAALRAQLEQARIAVDRSEVDLGYTRINAPINGTVVTISTKEGQTVVSAQMVTSIVTLADLDTMTVKAEISEADVGRVRPGLEVNFTVLGSRAQHQSVLRAIEPAPVTKISDSTSASTAEAVYYHGLFDVENPDHALRIGMTAQVRIVLQRARQALVIPSSVLRDPLDDGHYEVAVLRKGQVERRRIRIGISDDVYTQVLSGLNEGEEVVLSESVEADLPDKNVARHRRHRA